MSSVLVADRPRVPAEFVGRARDLRRRVEAADVAAGPLPLQIMHPLCERYRRHPVPRAEALAAAAWRGIPQFARLTLDIVCERKHGNAIMWVELRPAMLSMVAEQRELQRELINVGRALSFFFTTCGPYPYPDAETDPEAAALKSAVFDADTPPVRWDGALAPEASPLDARWRAFRAALLADAGAKLSKG